MVRIKYLNTRKFPVNIITLVMLFWILPMCLLSQDKKIYQSNNFSYQNDIVGEVKYNYTLNNLDTVLVGPFSFKSTQRLTDNTYQYKTIILEGEFLQNLKNREWQFVERKLTRSNNTAISEYNILTTTSGIEKQVRGPFSNGKPNGLWKVVELNFENSVQKDTISNVSAIYNEGYLNGLFEFISSNINILGSFDENGFFDGEWVYKHSKEIKEIRSFENGTLIKVSFVINGQTNKIYELEKKLEQDETWVEMGKIDVYFEILELITSNNQNANSFEQEINLDSVIKLSNKHTYKSLNSFGEHNGLPIWNLSVSKQVFNSGKFKLKKHQISEEDSVLIKNIKTNYEVINEALNFFSQYPKIKIKAMSDAKLARIGAIFNVYGNSSKELNYLQKIISSKYVEYVDYPNIIAKYLPQVDLNTNTSYQFNDDTINLDRNFPSLTSGEEINLLAFSNLTDAMLDDVNRQYEILKIILSDSEKLDIIKGLEDEFYEKGDSVISLFTNAKSYENYNVFHKNVSASILNKTSQILSDYDSFSVNTKNETIQDYIVCFDTFIDFWNDLVELNKKYVYLDQEYSRIVFNPFLMSDIKERLKERVYKAYEEYLIPYLFKDINADFQCEKVSSVINDFNKIYNRMIELKEIDTKEEEANLRRQRDASRILDILNITLN